MIVPKGSVPKIPITMGESGWAKAADGHSTNFAKLKMKPALIRYSEESDESRACAKASGAQRSEFLVVSTSNLPPAGGRQLGGSPAINLKSDSNTSKNAALYHGRGGVDEIRQKFQVLVIQQVLPADQKFQISRRPPTDMRIQGVVTGQTQAGKVVHKSKGCVQVKMSGQVD